MLKANLEKPNSVNDQYLEQLITSAMAEIRREGIALTSTSEEEETYSEDDANLIVMQAAYFYRQRVASTETYQTAALRPQGEPYMLRYAKNNRLFSQKMRTES